MEGIYSEADLGIKHGGETTMLITKLWAVSAVSCATTEVHYPVYLVQNFDILNG